MLSNILKQLNQEERGNNFFSKQNSNAKMFNHWWHTNWTYQSRSWQL